MYKCTNVGVRDGSSLRGMRRWGGYFLTPRSRVFAFFVRGRNPNKLFKPIRCEEKNVIEKTKKKELKFLCIKKQGGTTVWSLKTDEYILLSLNIFNKKLTYLPHFNKGKFIPPSVTPCTTLNESTLQSRHLISAKLAPDSQNDLTWHKCNAEIVAYIGFQWKIISSFSLAFSQCSKSVVFFL